MRIIITEDQFNRNISFIRRLSIADDIMLGIVWDINQTLGIKDSYYNKDLYRFFEDFGYYDKLKNFFHKSFELCK